VGVTSCTHARASGGMSYHYTQIPLTRHETFMKSLCATFFGERFCVNRKGGGGGCTHRVTPAWLHLGSVVERPWLALGGQPICVLSRWQKWT